MKSFIIARRNRHAHFFSATVLAIVASLALGLGIAYAQDSQEQQPSQGQSMGPMGHHRGMPSVDDQVKHLTKKLDLTDDQQTKLKPILEDQHKQMEQIHNDSSLSRDDRFSKMQQVWQTTDTQIKALLTPDQQKKFDQMRQEQRGRMMEHGGMGMGGQKPDSQPQ